MQRALAASLLSPLRTVLSPGAGRCWPAAAAQRCLWTHSHAFCTPDRLPASALGRRHLSAAPPTAASSSAAAAPSGAMASPPPASARVAVGQMTATADMAANFAVCSELAAAAAAAGASLLCLPECFNYIGARAALLAACVSSSDFLLDFAFDARG